MSVSSDPRGGSLGAVEEATCTSADGTRITYYRIGEGPQAWLMPPAMGAPLVASAPLLRHFHESHSIVTWDMRGFYRSGAPADERAYTVEHHLEDLEAVRRASGLERYVLGGWSMGVQLSLAHYRVRPQSVEALVLINGTFERVLDSVVPHRRLAPVLSTALRALRHAAPLANPISQRVLGIQAWPAAMVRMGILAHDDSLHMAQALSEFRKVHWGRYLTVIRNLHAHSTADALREVRVPALITAGGRDRMTPPAVAERLHRGIEGSELFVIDEGTHYMPLEFPSELAAVVHRFLSRAKPLPVR